MLLNQKKLLFNFVLLNTFLHVYGVKTHQLKPKNSETKQQSLCFGRASKDFKVDNMTKAKVNEYVYDLSVDFHIINVSDIVDIPKYLRQ